jgi:predicted Zn-dependent protease
MWSGVMRNLVRAVLLIVAGSGLVGACEQAPVTGRSRISPIGDQQLNQQGIQLYREELAKNPLSRDPAYVSMVQRVGQRIARAAETPPDEKWMPPNYRWEFNVIDKPDVINAYCLPGGKIAVYTGIFRVAPDDDTLAAIMGHEVAHALLRHHGERMAQQGAVGAGAAIAGAVVGAMIGRGDRGTGAAVGAGLGIAGGVMLLSFSRDHEYEADRVGMILAAHAGYDPRAALTVWQRMGEAARGRGRPPEFLSSHPTESARLREIQAHLPEALQYYKPGR